MYGILLLLHILSATIWTGGHIALSVAVLPSALKESSPEALLDFESAYEKVGMPLGFVSYPAYLQKLSKLWLGTSFRLPYFQSCSSL